MFSWRGNEAARNAVAQTKAINASQAVIEFNMDGTIITANEMDQPAPASAKLRSS